LSDATAFQPIDLRTARLLAGPASKNAAKRDNFSATRLQTPLIKLLSAATGS